MHALSPEALSKALSDAQPPLVLDVRRAAAFAAADALLPGASWLDPADIEHRISPRTRAIVIVHYAGHPCDMDAIMAIAARHGLRLLHTRQPGRHAQCGVDQGHAQRRA